MTTIRTAAPFAAIALAAVLLTACGSDDSSGGPATGASRPSGSTGSTVSTGSTAKAATGGGADSGDAAACDVTDPGTVTSVFGGTSAPEKAGQARNCEYALTGASAPLVEVYALGSSDDWDAQKAQAKDIGGPLAPIRVGDEAYSFTTPPNTIYVKDGGRIFGVQVVDLKASRSYVPDLTKLAAAIAG